MTGQIKRSPNVKKIPPSKKKEPQSLELRQKVEKVR
jgi:hypothetical protein